jgi:hypothetical protein
MNLVEMTIIHLFCNSPNINNRFRLINRESYLSSAINIISKELERVEQATISHVKLDIPLTVQHSLLIHPHIAQGVNMHISTEHYTMLDRDNAEIDLGIHAIINGDVIFEHTAAGAATRLGLGTKYTITPLSLLEAILDGKIMPNDSFKEDIIELKKELSKNLDIEHIDKVVEIRKEIQKKEEIIAKSLSQKEIDTIISSLSNMNNVSLGTRKLGNFAFSTAKLAKDHFYQLDNAEKIKIASELNIPIAELSESKFIKYVLQKQTHMIILNQDTDQDIIKEIFNFKFFGFNPENIFFMVVNRLPSFSLNNGKILEDTPYQLHNHGVFRMFTVMDHQYFTLEEVNDRKYYTFEQIKDIFAKKKIFISNNIEDLDQLKHSPFDLQSISLALHLFNDQDYNMIMTGTRQKGVILKDSFASIHGLSMKDSAQIVTILNTHNVLDEKNIVNRQVLDTSHYDEAHKFLEKILPSEYHSHISDMLSILKAKPQKGGFFAIHENNVYCYESDQAPDLDIRDIELLNKNVNMFKPLDMLEAVKTGNFHPHTTLKSGKLIPQVPQGDLNFIMKMRVIVENIPKPLNSLKEQSELTDTINAFNLLDNNPKYIKFLQSLHEIRSLRTEITEKVERLGNLADMIEKFTKS